MEHVRVHALADELVVISLDFALQAHNLQLNSPIGSVSPLSSTSSHVRLRVQNCRRRRRHVRKRCAHRVAALN